MIKISVSKINWGGVFLVLLVLQALFFEYNRQLPLEPHGRHKWRQSDSASFAWGFSESTSNLFAPQVNNLTNQGQVALEFPLIYWVVGMLYRVFGVDPLIFRLVHVVLGFWGLWSLFQIKRKVLGDAPMAILLTLLVFTSPILAYYLINFIPDVPSLALALVGWHQLVRHYQRGTPLSWYLAAISMGIAVLLKASTGIHLVTWLVLLAFEKLKWTQWTRERPLFPLETWRYGLSLLSIVVAVIAWYVYASWYSTGWEKPHFSNLIALMSYQPEDDWLQTIGILFTNRFRGYFPSLFMLLLLLLGGLCFSSFGRSHRLYFAVSLLTLLGVLSYLFLFFALLRVHDYYLLVTLALPMALLVQSGKAMQAKHLRVFQSWALRLALLALLLLGCYQTRRLLRSEFRRFPDGREHPALYQPEFRAFLNQVGATPAYPIITAPDPSPNNTLYLMRRRGWTLDGPPQRIGADIDRFRQGQPKTYLVITDSSLVKAPALTPFTQHPLGEFRGVHVFLLDSLGAK